MEHLFTPLPLDHINVQQNLFVDDLFPRVFLLYRRRSRIAAAATLWIVVATDREL